MENNNAKKQKFIDLLHELFQLNQPELDFGLYRIMHAKSGQIKAFIETDLAREIDQAFAAGGDGQVAELKAAYEQARAQAKEFGIENPDSNPKVKEAREIYDAARENGDDPSDIYDHLYRFFSRYYDKGDFLSRRYHVAENDTRAAPYAVPYDGREVYLHWANKDQYYIKSSEYLSNFSFDLAEALKKERQRQGAAGQVGFDFEAEGSRPLKVTFQLVEAAEGAHNNARENQSRFFIIHAEKPVEISPLLQDKNVGGISEAHPPATELIINFEYRPDPEKTGQEGTWQKKRLEEAENVILDALKQDQKAKTFREALAFLAPTENKKERTLLGKYLISYTARNTMDYFIHKDLGGFLCRELDFYIKNEIMRLDDLSAEDVSGVTRSLKKITALRTIARQIIDFLAQLEEFQKKLWLKKKFVTEVNYCITLDRVPEKFYDEIVANEQQWAQWEELGFITEETKRTKQTLIANPYMMVDTGLFDEDFKGRLLAGIEGLDEQCDGLLLKGDNYQCVRLLSAKDRFDYTAIYLDPPYNTDASSILYKNDYKDSSWLSMINERLSSVYELMAPDSIICMAIDDEESAVLKHILDSRFEKEIGTAAVRSNPQSRKTKGSLSPSHEYAFFYGKSEKSTPGSLELSEKRLARYPFTDEKGRFAWMNFIRTGNNDRREDRPKLYYPIYVNSEDLIRIPEMEWSKNLEEYVVKEQPNNDEVVVYPVRKSDGKRIEKNWHRGYKRIIDEPDEYRVRRNSDGNISIDFKTRMDEEALPSTWWDKAEYASANYGASELKDLFGEKNFDFPKARKLVEDCLKVSGMSRDKSKVLDFFAGSGTTGHAVVELEREKNIGRKYTLVEMGEHFSTVVKPRIQKAVFSAGWKNGKPKSDTDSKSTGISHCFKYLRIESYEDTLNNLLLDGNERRADLLAQEDNTRLRKDYLLHYFLDVETRGSASLLNVEQFRDPTAYTLMVKKPGSDAQAPVKVDLVETFNWLIGLEVVLLDRPRIYTAEFQREQDPELPEDQHTRLQVARFKEAEDGTHWFRVVRGYVHRTPGSDADRERVMVVWRKLTDDPEKDAAALEALLEKYRVNQADSEFDKIYINGSHGLTLSSQAKARLLNLEETFMARMWEGTEQGALH